MQNLVWGVAGVFVGILANRFGALRVIVIGSLLYAAGLVGMSHADSPLFARLDRAVQHVWHLHLRRAGAKMPRKYILAFIYRARAVAITLFLLVPLSPVSVYIFSAAMGVLWLSTVPPTNATVAQILALRIFPC